MVEVVGFGVPLVYSIVPLFLFITKLSSIAACSLSQK